MAEPVYKFFRVKWNEAWSSVLNNQHTGWLVR